LDASLLRWYGTRFVARACWERELPSLLASRGRALWTALGAGRELACLLGTYNENGQFSIMLLGLSDDATHGDVRALLVTALGEVQSDTVRIGLEPIESRCAEMLRHFGFRLDKDLWEMVKTL